MTADPLAHPDGSPEPPAPEEREPKREPSGDRLSRTSGGQNNKVSGFAIPEKLGHYQILRELGRGGMGSVYLARDTTLDREVALKVPWIDERDGEEIRLRFLQEAQSAAKLTQHPNICQVFEFGEVDGQPFLAMEYLTGKTLSAFTKPGNLPTARQSAILVRKIALAVQAAHEKGLVHRDLKPGNIMLVPRTDGRKGLEPKVMDFGLAKSLGPGGGQLTRSGTVLGTPYYMSKEQWMGKEGEVGQISDVYSLGVIFYQLLTGYLPYTVDESSPATAYLAQMLTQAPVMPLERAPTLDNELASIALKAISVEKSDRYPSMREFAEVLQRWLDDTKSATPILSEPTLSVGLAEFGVDAKKSPQTPSIGQAGALIPLIPKDVRLLETPDQESLRLARVRRTRRGLVLLVVLAGLISVTSVGILFWMKWDDAELPFDEVVASSPVTPQPINQIEIPSNPVRENPLPKGSEWEGTLYVNHPNKIASSLKATATVIESTEQQVRLRCMSVNKNGPFAWEYILKPHESEFVVAHAYLESNWDEPSGERLIHAGKMTIENNQLRLFTSRPRLGGSTEQTFVLNRVQIDTIPLGSKWSGKSVAVFKDKSELFYCDCEASVTQRDNASFTLRAVSINKQGPFTWEFRCIQTEKGFELDRYILVSNNWNTTNGSKIFTASQISLDEDNLEILVSPAPTERYREQRFQLRRSEENDE